MNAQIARDILPAAAPGRVFSPDAFFAQPSWGSGVVTLVGLPIARFEVRGDGRRQPDGSYVFEQHFSAPKRPAHTVEWRVSPERGGEVYRAVDLKSRVEAIGRRVGDAFEWRFEQRVRTRLGACTVRALVRYAMGASNSVVGTTVCTVFGLPLVRVVAFYGRAGEA